MNKCIFTGIVYKQDQTTFSSGALSKSLWIEEIREKENDPVNKLKVDFNGYYAKEVPTNDLKGCEVAVFGKLVGKEARNDNIMTHIRGIQLVILAYPRFEQEEPKQQAPYDYFNEPSRVEIDDADLPF